MGILNKEELRRQIREGKEVSIDGILDELKIPGTVYIIIKDFI